MPAASDRSTPFWKDRTLLYTLLILLPVGWTALTTHQNAVAVGRLSENVGNLAQRLEYQTESFSREVGNLTGSFKEQVSRLSDEYRGQNKLLVDTVTNSLRSEIQRIADLIRADKRDN